MSDFTLSASSLVEPQAKQHSIQRTIHGIRLIDEYAWLKAENWQSNARSVAA
jgi:oligopeptidase B